MEEGSGKGIEWEENGEVLRARKMAKHKHNTTDLAFGDAPVSYILESFFPRHNIFIADSMNLY